MDRKLGTVSRHHTYSTLLDCFFENVRTDPNGIANTKVTVHGDKFVDLGITYEDLNLRAARYSKVLAEMYHLQKNDRIIISISDPHAFLTCALASMLNGFIIVPLPTFSNFGVPEEFLTRIKSVADDCDPKLIIIENSATWNRYMSRLQVKVSILEVGQLHLLSQSVPFEPDKRPDPEAMGEIAFIQYTSGSTGTPKGVVITHQNLASNLNLIGQVSKINPEKDSLLSWLPLYHDMGLIGNLFFPLYWHIPVFVLSPMSFVGRPVSWLKAIQHYGATYSVAPSFAYSVAYRKISDKDLANLDLSCWRLAFIGAEPIQAETAKGFVERFSKYGFRASSFYPVYGMAEATLALAFPPCNKPSKFDTIDRIKLIHKKVAEPSLSHGKDAITFISVGNILPEHSLSIVDPVSGEKLPERNIGEIVVKGPSVSPYYFSTNPLKMVPRLDLKTGDIGYIAGGELYVIDRLKDLIIVSGQNFFPSDIETQLIHLKGIRPGRVVAFSVPNHEGTESLNIVAEIKPKYWRIQEKIRSDITKVVNDKFGLKVEEVLLRIPGALPKTSSGKVKRRACRDLYVTGKLKREISIFELLSFRLKQAWRKLHHIAYTGPPV